MTSGVIGNLLVGLVLSAVAVDAASAATCCVASANVCSAVPCEIPNVGGNCPIAAYAEDCGAPHYCTFDRDLGCQTTNPCTAAKFRAVGGVAYRVLKCDTSANAKGVAVDPACTNKALAKLTTEFAKADALGPCPGSVATLQNDILVFAGNLNGAVGNTTSPRTASKCDAQKVKAMSRMARDFLGAMSRAASTARSPFPGLLSANHRAALAIGTSNTPRPGCTNGSNRNGIQDDAVDPFVTTVSDDLTSP
jgi:hypothetical protein